jgi:acetyl-CoA C-acetyltransferase
VDASIIGWKHLTFGKREHDDAESMIVEAVRGALEDAEIEAKDIDRIFLGTLNAGMVYQDFPASLVLQADEAFRFKPATRVENACATGSAAIHAGLAAIRARDARIVLVVGVEKMTAVSASAVGDLLMKASYAKEERAQYDSFAGLFGQIADQYFGRFGDQSDPLARIAAKNHRNGAVNPFAHIRKDLGYEFCSTVSERNPLVVGPLRRTDCSPVSDGAAAIVLADTDTAATRKKSVAFRAAVQVNDFLPMSRRDMTQLEGCSEAWRQALVEAAVNLDDLSLVETHDCFTIAELMQYEAMALTAYGEGRRAIDEGWVEKTGRLPVNPSGGLKAKGHPVGATGVSMHIMAAMQALGVAGDMQIPGATLTGVFNMGGAGVANYASILEAVRAS